MGELTQAFRNGTLNLNFSGLLSSLSIVSKAEFETISIVFDQDQFEMLLESLKEAQEGKVVSLKEAFSDLN